jgi:hypothetical protein
MAGAKDIGGFHVALAAIVCPMISRARNVSAMRADGDDSFVR